MDRTRKAIEILLENNEPRQYASLLKTNAHLRLSIEEYGTQIGCQTLMESLFCYLNKTKPKLCDCGNPALFNNVSKGYRLTCGINCQARYKKQGKKMSKFWKENPDKYENMIENRNETNLERYGNVVAAKNIDVGKKIAAALRKNKKNEVN